MIVRVLLAVAAVAAAVWVGTSLRAAQLEAQAGDELSGATRQTQRERIASAARLLERARKWAPDQAPVTTEAALLFRSGRQRRAEELMDDLVAREPDNPGAWGMLAAVASDPARRREAARRARELNPPVARR